MSGIKQAGQMSNRGNSETSGVNENARAVLGGESAVRIKILLAINAVLVIILIVVNLGSLWAN